MTDKQPITIKWLSFCECGMGYGGHFINSDATQHEDVIKEQQQILDGQKALEELENWKGLYQDYKKMYDVEKQENQKLKEQIQIKDRTISVIEDKFEYHRTESQKLKAEIEELRNPKRCKYGYTLRLNEICYCANTMRGSLHITDKESKQAIEIIKKIETQGIENIVEDLLYDMNRNFNSGMLNVDEIRIQFNRQLQSILKGDKN